MGDSLLPFPSTFLLCSHVTVRGGGLGWLFSTSPGCMLELLLPCQESSGREEKLGGGGGRWGICCCILAGVSGPKRFLGLWSGVSCKYSCSQWIEAPMPVENKPLVTGLLQLQDGSGNSPASILGGRMLPVLPKDGGARNECC